MWKKIKKCFTLCCAALLIVIATVSGTLAYESYVEAEWKSAVDPKVSVTLIQQQRSYGASGEVDGLEDFTDDKVLVPLVASAQYDGSNFDQYGMPMADGYVDQIVRVKNEGSVHAYVRVIVAIPAALDDANDAGHNALHWNFGNRFMPNGDFSSANSENTAFHDISWECTGTTTIDNIIYNLYTFTYNTPLGEGETTTAAAFTGFYLDRDVNVVNGHILLDDVDTGFTDEQVKIYVEAQAVQAYGFANVEAAFTEAAMTDDPWRITNN